jgi:hypothetical protein
MRLIAVTAAVVAAMFLPVMVVSPEQAEAHHVDNNNSNAACVLVNNVPTLQVNVVFVDFESYNKPVSWTITLNGTFDSTGLESWPAEENPHTQHWVKSGVTANTSYSIVYSARWGRGYTTSLPFETVICPQPVPPPVVTDCKGNPVPPGGTPATCLPPVTVPPPVTTPPIVTPPATPPCVLTRTHRVRVRAKERSSITVNLTNTPTGSPVTLKLPRQKTITGATDETGTVVFKFRAKHRGVAVVTTNCGSVRAKVRPPHKTTSHRPPRTVG